MGWRYRRSIRLAPGLRINLGKRGVSVTAGGRGGPHYTVHSSGRHTVSVGVPGTGLSWQQSSTPLDGAAPGGAGFTVLPDFGSSSRRGGRRFKGSRRPDGASSPAGENPFASRAERPPPPPTPPPPPGAPPQTPPAARSHSRQRPHPCSLNLRWTTSVLLALVLVAAHSPTPRIAAQLAVAGARLALLVVVVAAAWQRQAIAQTSKPRKPRLEPEPRVVVPPAPPTKILVPQTSCRWCSRPLTDPVSMRSGAGPTCRQRYGPAQQYCINSAYVAWGERLHERRLTLNATRAAVAARNENSRKAHVAAVAAWNVEMSRPKNVAAVKARTEATWSLAASLVALLVACSITATPRHVSPTLAVTQADKGIVDLVASPAPSDPPSVAPSNLPTEPQAVLEATPTVEPSPTPPPLPDTLSSMAVLHAVPDCVGGVCTLQKRTDVLLTEAQTGARQRVVVALLREPGASFEGGVKHVFVAVDAATQQELGNGIELFEKESDGPFHEDRDAHLFMALRSTPQPYLDSSMDAEVLAVSNTGISLDKPIFAPTSPQAVHYLGLDANDHFRWSADVPRDGSTVTTTVGWTGSGYDVTSCRRRRNGDAVNYRSDTGC